MNTGIKFAAYGAYFPARLLAGLESCYCIGCDVLALTASQPIKILNTIFIVKPCT